MASFNFPSSPTNGQTYSLNGITFKYSSTTGIWGVVGPLTGKTIPSGDIVGTSDSQSLSTKTLVNPVITNYTETIYSPSAGSSFTIDLNNGTVQKITSNANLTITLPASSAGKSFIIIVAYGGIHTLTINGGSTIKWPSNTTPTPTSVSGKFDIFSFLQDGLYTYATTIGQNY
jgi:hypothetical protein